MFVTYRFSELSQDLDDFLEDVQMRPTKPLFPHLGRVMSRTSGTSRLVKYGNLARINLRHHSDLLLLLRLGETTDD